MTARDLLKLIGEKEEDLDAELIALVSTPAIIAVSASIEGIQRGCYVNEKPAIAIAVVIE